MFERFTQSAREVVSRASMYALETTASQTRPEHLLQALLDQPACLALNVLEEMGAPPARIRETLERERRHHVDGLDAEDAEALQAIGIDLDEVVRRIDRNLGGMRPGREARSRKPRFSRPAKKVLELALREALRLRHNYIGSEHILLGLANSGDRVVGDTFAELQLSLPTMRATVADAVRRAG